MAKNWIAKAVSKNPGSFKKAAKRAHMSTSAYANKVLKKGSKVLVTTKRRARLAKTLARMRAKRGR